MTDEAMLELLDSDPSEGIRLLIDRYSSLVYTVAYGKLKGVLSTDDIEDFVSFIFSRIYERRAGIDLSRGTLKGYIVTVARRMCIDEYRRCRARVATEPLTAEIAEIIPDARKYAGGGGARHRRKGADRRAAASWGEGQGAVDPSVLL